MKNIQVPDDLYLRLAELAEPFVDKSPADVIRRYLPDTEHGTNGRAKNQPSSKNPVVTRLPRERGAVVDIDGTTIEADTVGDLTNKVMQHIRTKGKWVEVKAMAPYKTSGQRYLFAAKAKHPSGREFVAPIQCFGLYVETHKNYQTAIKQLTTFVAKLGMQLTYRGT